MLDDGLKTQLKTYLANVTKPVELVATLDASPKAQELRALLEDVAAQGHEIAKKVLDWRQLSKLRGTYTEALPTYINPKTGRVHTSYAMAAASTGTSGRSRVS